MSLLFELEQHQKLVVYEEGNQILAVRLPLRRGGEFRMRDGCLSDLTGVIYRGNIRLAWQSLEHHIILSGTEEQSYRIVLSDGYHVRQYGGLKLVAKDQGLWLLYSAKEPEKDVWELFEKKRTAQKFLPIASVLTIAAAGSETSNSCVITNEETKEKRSYNDDIARPKFAIMNPELTMTLPDYQTESGCTDIMMHTMERYFTQGGNMEITDEIAEGLLRTVMKYAKILHHDPTNYEARAEIMWSGSLAHNGLTGCGNDGGDFASHMLEHEMGGMFDVTHGAGLAAIWPSWARYVYKNCLPRFVRYATHVMGVTPGETDEKTALKGIEAMEDFYHEIGMPVNFKELGIAPTDEQIKEMADSCARASGGHKGSAKDLYPEDMIAIYRMANQE